ncbi:MAG TPA: SDR family oxidoreductase [Chthonomonadales bacterium]|nr:SDR family oxidoreductase [Chthonomonadales bacterium]
MGCEELKVTSLRNKVVVITGASAGIGRECARLFAEEGAHVVVAARRRERLEALKAEIEARGGKCLAVPTDVADRALVQRLLDATLEHFGRVDVWINNAGFGLVGSVEQTTPEEMQRLMNVNFMGAFHGCQVALQQMRRQGSGHIINISSMAARFPLPLGAGYAATKAAMNAFAESLGMELEGSGIRVSIIMPGYTDTEFGQAAIKKIPPADVALGPTASARSVAAQVVRCAKRPRPMMALAPLPRLAFAFFDLFPSAWRAICRYYVKARTRGKGIPLPPE